MGPVTLFDKSFLQSLSEDESVWFDNFFLTNVCPIFYVETLADLDKSVREDRTPEQEVGLIADKFPEMNCHPSAYHAVLCIGNLMGHEVPMTGQIPLPPGDRLVKSQMGVGFVYEPSHEADAFSRWRNREFLEIERLYASQWRETLGSLDLEKMAKLFSSHGIDAKSCQTLSEAKLRAELIVQAWEKTLEGMKAALVCLNVSRALSDTIIEFWQACGHPPISSYAPYATYVLTVELFFGIALASKHISSAKPSTRMDMAYLFYLPFCRIFVSSDNLHRRCAPLFLAGGQEFVWGQDLKADLAKLNAFYMRLPEETRCKGIMSFAKRPPTDSKYLVAKLWDHFWPAWRQREEESTLRDPAEEAQLIEELEKVAQAPSIEPGDVEPGTNGSEFMLFQSPVRIRKGSWWQLPKELETDE